VGVILSEALKDPPSLPRITTLDRLSLHRGSPFFARGTCPLPCLPECHPERSEGSATPSLAAKKRIPLLAASAWAAWGPLARASDPCGVAVGRVQLKRRMVAWSGGQSHPRQDASVWSRHVDGAPSRPRA